ncbi:immunoglobulin superfamily member 1-like [Gracilinanus agilis]|uniref:immunoglobulin superfamily member 1-like n=1 Tax=Gracilinanus agilis TaxID=191870 RepID=UPI001CFC8F5C|nr:immunoglobulin superfamily member 1-like [Gracilinanus agilis]
MPSPVVSNGSDVTFRCQGPLRSGRFQLWKDRELRDERNASKQLAEFKLRNVDGTTDARSYSCRYAQGPLWSEFSEPLALVVTGFFSQPYISTQTDIPISSGRKVTIFCEKSPITFSQDYIFVLLEAKSLKPLRKQSSSAISYFIFPSVRIQDSGNYSCIYYKKTAPYKGSQPSQALKLTILGTLPKPTLWTLSGLVVIPGTNITFWCSRPKLSFLKEVTFILWKPWTRTYLNAQSSGELWTSFVLPSVRPEDTGSYSCTYKEMTASARNSEGSDVLKLVVTDALPKASLSIWPAPEIASGVNVTLLCQGPSRYTEIVLYKEGDEKILPSTYTTQDGAQFFLTHVTPKHSGNYSCGYQSGTEDSLWTQLSDPLELIVRASESSNTLIITLSCVSFFLLLLCILLLAFICCGSIPMGECDKDRVKPLRV